MVRRSNRVRRNVATNRSSAVHVIEVIEDEEDPYKTHRTCWMHTAAYMRDSKKKLSIEELERLKEAAPCFYNDCIRSQRSMRIVKSKYLVSKLRKRLTSTSFASYLEALWRSFSDDQKIPFMFLNCVWFTMYMNATSRSNVLKWIQAKKIFSKKYVFVPIVYWSHWNLLILCNFAENLEAQNGKTCMLLLDSLQALNPRRLEQYIRKFVLDIFRAEGRTEDLNLVSDIPLLIPEVPQQPNEKQCGSFVLYYIHRFMEDAPENLSIDGYPYFMKQDWFTLEALDDFCKKLNSLGTIM